MSTRSAIALVPKDGAVDPSLRVAGLSLLLRAVLSLQRDGAEHITIVVPAQHHDFAKRVAADPRVIATTSIAGTDHTHPMATVARYDVVGGVALKGKADVGSATKALFETCRKPVDGVVSRHFNRHISLFISRLLVNTPVTPNMMTFATFGVSLVAAWLVLEPTYLNTALGGVLMQANSILDGCDGELARVRYQGSKLGQWLDTIGDDVSNVIFWAALGFGAAKLDHVYAPYLAVAGWIGAGANGFAAVQNYILLATKGSGDFYALRQDESTGSPGFVGSVVALFNVLLRQDFFLAMVAVVALAGYLPWLTPVVAAGAVITLAVSTVRFVRALLSRKRAT